MRLRLRLYPRSLTGQLILLLLGSLAVAQAVALQVVHDERRFAQRLVFKSQVLERIAAAGRLIADSPTDLRPQILKALQTEDLRFWIASEPLLTTTEADPESRRVLRRLADLLPGMNHDLRLRIETEDVSAIRRFGPPPGMVHRPPPSGMMAVPPPPRPGRSAWRACIDEKTGFVDQRCIHEIEERRHPNLKAPFVIGAAAAIRLPDGKWLNAETSLVLPPLEWAAPSLLAFGLSAALIVVVVTVMVRYITRPLGRLAQAAERLGRGEEVGDLPVTGPDSLRSTTRAFNLMNRRLQNYVRDRMHFLASVSHDLRTPLTSLRLRAEFVDDEENRAKILETVEEMSQMVDAVLTFVREETRYEETRRVDIASLIESVCDDFSDMGRPVVLAPLPEGMPSLNCRPLSLKRALRNLIENAVKYGDSALVSARCGSRTLFIDVDDCGPGLTPAEIERIFEPFVRLENSRNRETGGVGLGLSIARSIAQSHGGGLTAVNRDEGGLRMTLHLPL